MGNEKYEEYYDSEMYIPYNGRIVFVYGSPAFGDLNFPGREEYMKKKQ